MMNDINASWVFIQIEAFLTKHWKHGNGINSPKA